MNNFSYPFPPFHNNQINILDEIIKIKEDLKRLEEKVNKLSQPKEKNYLKNDDSFYML